MNHRFASKENTVKLILMGITAILVTVTGIVYHQSLLHILPLYVSLFVALLQADANRYAPLFGGLNSALYAVVYLHLGLYAYAASTFFFACCFQLLAFVLWSKKRYRHSTKFRKMNMRLRAAAAVVFLLAFILVCFLLNKVNSSYAILDTLMSLLDAAISVLMPFAFIEYAYLMLPSTVINIFLNICTMSSQPGQITYVVFLIYALLCRTQSLYTVKKLYAQQQSDTSSA